MKKSERYAVAWVAVIAMVSLTIVASDHGHSIYGGLLVGITSVVVGWWIL